MIRYRLRFINPNTNQVDREREIEAADDVDAGHVASESDHRPLELWCGERRVRRLGAEELALAGDSPRHEDKRKAAAPFDAAAS